MTAEELRIGNWVYSIVDDTYYQVTGICEDIELGILTYRITDINAIPLNEEWAISFGYECLLEMANDFSESKYGATTTQDALKAMNVHYAQNLYFYLKNEELTIKHDSTNLETIQEQTN